MALHCGSLGGLSAAIYAPLASPLVSRRLRGAVTAKGGPHSRPCRYWGVGNHEFYYGVNYHVIFHPLPSRRDSPLNRSSHFLALHCGSLGGLSAAIYAPLASPLVSRRLRGAVTAKGGPHSRPCRYWGVGNHEFYYGVNYHVIFHPLPSRRDSPLNRSSHFLALHCGSLGGLSSARHTPLAPLLVTRRLRGAVTAMQTLGGRES